MEGEEGAEGNVRGHVALAEKQPERVCVPQIGSLVETTQCQRYFMRQQLPKKSPKTPKKLVENSAIIFYFHFVTKPKEIFIFPGIVSLSFIQHLI